MANQPRPNTKGHYISSIDDELWAKAQATAAARGESISAAVRRFLEEYVK